MNVLVAADYELIVDGLRVVLRDVAPEITVLPARDIEEALATARRTDQIHLVILTLTMPGMGDLRGLDAFAAEFPKLPVVVIAEEFARDQVFDCMRKGAAGCVPKSFTKGALAGALKIVLGGQPFVPASYVLSDRNGPKPEASPSFTDGQTDQLDTLSPKERLVLRELVTGASNREIASRLGLEEATVKFHLRRIFRKLGTKNRGETIRLAIVGNR